MTRTGIVLFLLLVLAFSLFSQSAGPAAVPALPKGFRTIELGLSMSMVKERLLADPLYAYRGDPDVSFLPAGEQSLIECNGNSYLKRAFFQFHEDRLYIIILSLEQEKIDYYTLYKTLIGKYGDADTLNPSAVVWSSAKVRFSLEKPLMVKYIDKVVFDTIQD
ncbi:MAG TPA: hypothetical protein ENI27_03195, partial [bacterium]|nr:hypothetical protein [bacterium]